MTPIRTTVAGKDGKPVTIRDTWAIKPGELTVPFRDIDTIHAITLGFKQSMLDIVDGDGNGGEIFSGVCSDAIELRWKHGDVDRTAVVRPTDLLIAWVATFDPEAAAEMRKAVP